ncbi:histidine phosphatase family protein [Aquirhabdus parva]|nr:histidine phosphatase family protein [Aquirhabdus parva]
MSDELTQTLTHLPVSMHASLAQLPVAQPIVLLTRHSLRVAADGQGFASYALPLTEVGRELAYAWGEYLCNWTGREFRACLSSPIGRCVDTALRMLGGSLDENEENRTDIIETTLLVEPGSFVLDAARLSAVFRQYGALKFINAFLSKQVEGMKHPAQGVLDILSLLYDYLPSAENSVLLAVSHDTILAAFLAVMQDEPEITSEDWPEMMEGVFLWFDGDRFEDSQVHWVWRGIKKSRLVSSFVV